MSGIVPGAGRTFICLAEFCGRSEQITLMWLVETAMRKRVAEGTQGWSQRGAAPGPRLAVVTGVLGWGRTAGRPQGDTQPVRLLVGGGRRGD